MGPPATDPRWPACRPCDVDVDQSELKFTSSPTVSPHRGLPPAPPPPQPPPSPVRGPGLGKAESPMADDIAITVGYLWPCRDYRYKHDWNTKRHETRRRRRLAAVCIFVWLSLIYFFLVSNERNAIGRHQVRRWGGDLNEDTRRCVQRPSTFVDEPICFSWEREREREREATRSHNNFRCGAFGVCVMHPPWAYTADGRSVGRRAVAFKAFIPILDGWMYRFALLFLLFSYIAFSFFFSSVGFPSLGSLLEFECIILERKKF